MSTTLTTWQAIKLASICTDSIRTWVREACAAMRLADQTDDHDGWMKYAETSMDRAEYAAMMRDHLWVTA